MTINPIKGFDCDGDGVTNWQEVQSFTDPKDECDLNLEDIDFEVSIDWYDEDCDGDSYNNSIDVFPFNLREWYDTDKDQVGNNKDLDDVIGIVSRYTLVYKQGEDQLGLDNES